MIYGIKRHQFIEEMIVPNLPKDWKERVLVEPFGGSFAVGHYLKNLSKITTIYNDIVKYDITIKADVIFNTDYYKVIESFNTNDCFFYIDPPYYGKEEWYNMEKNNTDFHVALFNSVRLLKCPFMISYEDCDFIRSLYKEYTFVEYNGDNKTFRHEILIKNFK